MKTGTHSLGMARWLRKLAVGLSVASLAAFVAACDMLLDVESPAAVDAEFLEDPANAALAVSSAIADFECAFGEYIVAGGLIGNELWDSQLAARMWSYDRRDFTETGGVYATFTCGSDPGVYQTLSTARFAADNAARILENASGVANQAALLATANAYAGYARLLLGEGMCTAAIDAGPELTSQQMFALAEEKFTAALSGGTSDITNMARVGLARARLNQGNTAGALADAQQVPAGFVKYATSSSLSSRANNHVFRLNNFQERVSVEDEFHNLSWKGVPDPRVAVRDEGVPAASDDLTPLWTQQKYADRDAPIPIARYAEAQLIIAEVQGGQTAVDIINALHAAAGLPAFDPATDGPVADHILQERQRELFLESHHLYDKIRFGDPFLPVAGTPYQETGAKGGFYGATTCLPLPLVEIDNNPNITR